MIKPALCITLQGNKIATYGSTIYEYRAGHGLVVTIEMPERGTAFAAGTAKPFLGLTLELDLQVLQESVEAKLAEMATETKGKGAGPFTLELNDQLIDCALRTVRLLATPEAIPALYQASCGRFVTGSSEVRAGISSNAS